LLKYLEISQKQIILHPMSCPHCSEPIPQDATECGVCGFSLTTMDARLGRVHAAIDPIMDVAHCLRLADRTMLEAVVDDFERRFPQIHLALFLGVLPTGMNVSEAGFWILNRGVRKRRGQVCDNRYGLLLVVDPAARQAGVSLGYALERLLPVPVLSAMLEKHSHHLWHSDYGTALSHLIRDLDARLRGMSRAQRRLPDPQPADASGETLGLRDSTRKLEGAPREEPQSHSTRP
jgi:hypothetical protein